MIKLLALLFEVTWSVVTCPSYDGSNRFLPYILHK